MKKAQSDVVILQFSVSNFRSLREKQTLNFEASNYDDSLPENCISPELPGLKNSRWVKGVALYGANASGKSTVLEALKVLGFLVRRSAGITTPDAEIVGITPFALDRDSGKQPTAFSLIFVTGGIRYEYRLALTRKQILHESLRAFPTGKEQVWFQREWLPETQSYRWSPEKPAGFTRDTNMEKRTLPNVLFLSKAVAENNTELMPVFQWITKTPIHFDLSARRNGSLGDFTLSQLNGDSELSRRIRELLQHADLGIVGSTTVEKRPSGEDVQQLLDSLDTPSKEQFFKNTTRLEPMLCHTRDSKTGFFLDWNTESAGTQRFFSLIGPWLEILEKGYVACIDEIETSMHPVMVRELLKLFFNEKTNPNGAQIIFTTHNPLLLDTDLIRRDQIWFTEKDDKGATHLYPLTDFKPRKEESLLRGYLAGRYGGLPFIPDGLIGTFPTEEKKSAKIIRRTKKSQKK